MVLGAFWWFIIVNLTKKRTFKMSTFFGICCIAIAVWKITMFHLVKSSYFIGTILNSKLLNYQRRPPQCMSVLMRKMTRIIEALDLGGYFDWVSGFKENNAVIVC